MALSKQDIQSIKNALQPEFEKIDQRFESIDQRFESINQRFESIDQHFESIDQRFESIDQRLDSLEKTMKAGFEQNRKDHNIITDYFDRQDIHAKKRLDRIEASLGFPPLPAIN